VSPGYVFAPITDDDMWYVSDETGVIVFKTREEAEAFADFVEMPVVTETLQ